MYPKMRIAGSLVHHLLICSLLVLYALSTLLFIAYEAFSNVLWFKLAYMLSALALVAGVLALAGYLSWTSRPTEARPIGLKYCLYSLLSLGLAAANLYLLFDQLHRVNPDAGYAVVLCAAGSISFIAATFIGWGLPEFKSEAASPKKEPKTKAVPERPAPVAKERVSPVGSGFKPRPGLLHS